MAQQRLAWPIEVDGSRLARVWQRTGGHADQQVAMLVRTQAGERVAQPQVGTPDLVDADPVDAQLAVERAIDRWAVAARRTSQVTVGRRDDGTMRVHVPVGVA
jgi:phage baseplate assembly protein W